MELELDPQRPLADAGAPRKRVSLPSAGQHRYHYKDGHLFVDGKKQPARPDAL